MGIWQDGLTPDQVARTVLRGYLIRCHQIISKDYPKIANMSAEEGADYLLRLKDAGQLNVQLYNKHDNRIGCRITERNLPTDNQFPH
jgi:hypothetical protein